MGDKTQGRWIPCRQKAACEEYSVFDDGCEESDLNNVTGFSVRALYLFAKHVFPRLNRHDQIIVNGLLTLIAFSINQSFESLLLENVAFFSAIYRILQMPIDLPPTLTNYAGITLEKKFLFEHELLRDEPEMKWFLLKRKACLTPRWCKRMQSNAMEKFLMTDILFHV